MPLKAVEELFIVVHRLRARTTAGYRLSVQSLQVVRISRSRKAGRKLRQLRRVLGRFNVARVHRLDHGLGAGKRRLPRECG